MRDINYATYPNQAMVPGLKRYFEEGIIPGGFLRAIISNDLKSACAQADDTNIHLLVETVRWFYNEVPAPAWGSPEYMYDWANIRQEAQRHI